MTAEKNKERLDELVVLIELTLISVIQGVALFFLADNTRVAVLAFDYEHWIYIAIGFMFLITFWSQAMVHIVSFITWPIELIHNFLYFLVVMAEVLMFTNIDKPLYWFGTNIVFFAVVEMLYYADYRLIQKKRPEFQESEEKKKFFEKILADQKFGMNVLVPIGAAFSVAAWLLITAYPTIFLDGHWHIALAAVQALFGFISLSYLVSEFRKDFITIGEI